MKTVFVKRSIELVLENLHLVHFKSRNYSYESLIRLINSISKTMVETQKDLGEPFSSP